MEVIYGLNYEMINVHVDGGALSLQSQKHFGNFVVTLELLRALSKVDKKNKYTVYAVDPIRADPACKRMIFSQLQPKMGWMQFRVSLQELLYPSDIFLGLNQSLPLFTKGRKIALCHGLSFMKYPELYPDSVHRMKRQIFTLRDTANWIVVSSQRVKEEWKKYVGDPHKIVIIPFGIPQAFLQQKRAVKKKPFLLFVGMNHPIKNIQFLIDVVTVLRTMKGYSMFTLTVVGVGNKLNVPHFVTVVPYASHKGLLSLYRQTQCVVSASLYESFNLPILEALSQKAIVIATRQATIPELEPFVTTAPEDPKQFARIIAKTIEYPKKTDLSKLRNLFSWQKFAYTLQAIYERK